MASVVESFAGELRQARKAQNQHTTATLAAIDSALQAIESCRAEIAQDAMDVGSAEAPVRHLQQALGGGKLVAKVNKEQKALHAAISKLSKAVDKKLPVPASEKGVCRPVAFDPKPLNQMIALHLYRSGHFRAAASLVQEAGLTPLDPSTYEPLVEICQVVQAMGEGSRDLGAAKKWAEEETRRAKLAAIDSTLPFQLARLEFVGVIAPYAEDEAARRAEALALAQSSLSKYTEGHMAEVMELMSAMLWAGRIDASPYAWLVSDVLWDDACDTVTADGCRVVGLPRESHLGVAFAAGMIALPTLYKMQAVVKSSNLDWNTIDELPVQIESLEDHFAFHSIFSCPVSREQATPDNPPVLLKCGHVICQSSVSRIPKRGSTFKCPTCPVEQKVSETKVLYL